MNTQTSIMVQHVVKLMSSGTSAIFALGASLTTYPPHKHCHKTSPPRWGWKRPERRSSEDMGCGITLALSKRGACSYIVYQPTNNHSPCIPVTIESHVMGQINKLTYSFPILIFISSGNHNHHHFYLLTCLRSPFWMFLKPEKVKFNSFDSSRPGRK